MGEVLGKKTFYAAPCGCNSWICRAYLMLYIWSAKKSLSSGLEVCTAAEGLSVRVHINQRAASKMAVSSWQWLLSPWKVCLVLGFPQWSNTCATLLKGLLSYLCRGPWSVWRRRYWPFFLLAPTLSTRQWWIIGNSWFHVSVSDLSFLLAVYALGCTRRPFPDTGCHHHIWDILCWCLLYSILILKA